MGEMNFNDPGELDALFSRRPSQYGRIAIPCDFDYELSDFIGEYMASPPKVTYPLTERLNQEQRLTLLGFSGRMASLALNENSPRRIVEGLTALALEGVVYDFRLTATAMSFHYHSAMRLGANPSELFSKAAAYGTQRATDTLMGFLKHPHHIEAMGFIETDGPKGHRFKQNW